MPSALPLTVLAAAIATASAVHAQPVTLHVDDDAPPGPATGLGWAEAFPRLDEALAAALALNRRDVVIKVAEGHYSPGQFSTDVWSSFQIASGLTLMGGFAGRLAADPDERDPARFVTILSGDNRRDDTPALGNRSDNSRHVLTTFDICRIDGFTIRGGHADGPASVNADRGGACFTAGSGAAFINCTFTDNFAATSGSVAWGLSTSSFLNCRFRGNFVGSPGAGGDGATISAGGLVAFGCTFTDNASPGSLVRVHSGSSLHSNLIAGNRSTNGAAVLTASGFVTSVDMLGNTIVRNRGRRASFRLIGPAQIRITNSILWQNVSDEDDPRRLFLDADEQSAAHVTACIVSNPPTALAADAALIVSEHILDTEPLFLDPDGPDDDPATTLDNDYRLRAGSPAIDSGAGNLQPYPTDADGLPRLSDDPGTPDRFPEVAIKTMDLGAFEFQGTSCRADWDGSGFLRPEDVPDFVDCWFTRDARSDFNRIDGPTFQDLLDYLTAYFVGCP